MWVKFVAPAVRRGTPARATSRGALMLAAAFVGLSAWQTTFEVHAQGAVVADTLEVANGAEINGGLQVGGNLQMKGGSITIPGTGNLTVLNGDVTLLTGDLTVFLG